MDYRSGSFSGGDGDDRRGGYHGGDDDHRSSSVCPQMWGVYGARGLDTPPEAPQASRPCPLRDLTCQGETSLATATMDAPLGFKQKH